MVCSPHQIYSGHKLEKNEMGGALAQIGKRRSAYSVSVEKPEGRIPLGRPRPRWEYNIKMGRGIGGSWTGLMWLGLGTGGGLL